MQFTRIFMAGLSVAAILMFMGACQTTKKKSEVSKAKKFYHTTTSLYNGYFNANVLVEEAIEDLSNDHSDDYSEILPIEKHMGSKNYKAAYPKLDTAIKKVSVVAAVHRMGEWTDDCYLLAGRAQYYKQDFEEAETILKYLVKEFNPMDPGSQYWKYKKNPTQKANEKKKKKKKVNSSAIRNQYASEAKGTGGLGNNPAYNEGRIWLAKTLARQNLSGQAQGILNDVKGKYHPSAEMHNLFHTAQAELFIHEGLNSKAAGELTTAMDYAPNRDSKARYAFIAAQLYELDGDHTRANIYYDKAQQLANSYDMIFNAKLNQLKSAYANGKRSRSAILSSLEKMTKDGKNDDYYDNIYYTMAQIYQESGELDDAVEYYTKALAHKTSNSTITLESYHALAMLYYDRDDFVMADTYLDSTIMIMPKKNELFNDTKNLGTKLKPIANNIRTINDLDSLIAISKMTPEEQREIALKMREEEEKLLAQEEADSPPGLRGGRLSGGSLTGGALNDGKDKPFGGSLKPPTRGQYRGSFFAYQEDSKHKRKEVFNERWGNVPLVDNWRVSSMVDKSAFSSEEDSIEPMDEENLISQAEIDQYLKDVPTDEEEVTTLERRIKKAMEELGFSYRSSLNRPDLTIEILEEMLERFPGIKHGVDVYYNLYLAYNEVGRTEQAQKYKDLILNKYPQSSIAENINNPTLKSEEENKADKLSLFYQSTYNEFTRGDYEKVHARVSAAGQNYGKNNKYAAKFALLDAMATGKTEGEAEYAKALNKLIADYKGTAEATQAREILRFLDGSQTGGGDIDLGNFVIDDDKAHYILISLKNSKDVSSNNSKNKVSDFNEKYFALDKLKVSSILLDIKKNKNPIIVVRQFKDKARAMRYYETAQQFKDNFMPEGADYTILATNQQNYREIIKSRTLVDYTEFFELHYLK